MVWHAGKLRALPVAERAVPFDADAGPDAAGHPVAVYSRCRRENVDWTRARGCRIYEIDLRGGRPRRLAAIGAPGRSDSTPTIWYGAVAFARQTPGARLPRIYLWRRGHRLQPLGGGSPPCRPRPRPCGSGTSGPPAAGVAAMDLDGSQLAFEWLVAGPLVTGIGVAPEIRTDSLVGDRAELADTGYTSGACGGEDESSPNAVGARVLYVHQLLDCDGPGAISGGEETHAYFESFSPAFRSFGFTAPQPAPTRYRHAPGANLLVALAWDGTTTYWIRARQLHPQDGQYFDDTYTCAPSRSRCTLMRTPGLFGHLRGEPSRERPRPQGA